MDLKDTVLRALNELVKNGGEGSGDFGHAGNPPHVGGSEPVGSRHARGFISKTQIEKNKKTQFNYGKKVKDNETKKEGVIIGSIPRGINPDTNEKMYLYEIKWNNGEIERKHSSKISIDTKNEDIKVNPAEKIGVKQSDSKDKQSDSKEKKEDKKYQNRHAEILYKDLPELRAKLHKAKYERAKQKQKGVDVSLFDKKIKEFENEEQKLKDEMTKIRESRRSSKERYVSIIEQMKANNSLYKHEYIEY